MRRPRLRFSVRQLMAAVLAFGLIFLVIMPLIRLGRPPCLSPVKTASWLISRPGQASCLDCHRETRILLAQSVPPVIPSTDACSRSAPPTLTSQSSCISCHQPNSDHNQTRIIPSPRTRM